MKPLFLQVFLAGMAGSLAWGQSGAKARELFYTPVPVPVEAAKPADPPKPAEVARPVTPAKPKQAAKAKTPPPPPKADTPADHTLQASVPLGLRYAVLRRDGANYKEVDPETAFRAGDRIRLQVDSNTSGYLYVVMQGSSGNWQLLFPTPEISGGSNHVNKGQSMQVPPGNSGQFVFDETAGTEKIFLVLTRQPEQDLDKLIYSMQQPPATEAAKDPGATRVMVAKATVSDDVINRLRSDVQSRDLIFEKVDTDDDLPKVSGVRAENAAYVVNKSTAPDARLVVDVALRHR